ncbi:phospholipase D family protein [Aureibaculum sp. 2210JD6-5]|uniref:phospholipase D family protein n=1 Tax=Aureibaculum sp. 2210JD6-5 TaxID=3103957 RepID=UPI002AAD30FE|nr:phospholipase D family protein [Aureibaculum sp. 2210JD6-5]MDY7395413.1 phospholipase D family protein [Aureibaculum sp. 2210JD6-5]
MTHIPYLKYFPLVFLCLLLLNNCKKPNSKGVSSSQDFCETIHRNDSISLSKELEDISAEMQSKTGVYVLEDGGGSLITRAWLTDYAEKTIDIQYFIFSTDNVGLIACDYLVRAADRGVKVRILVDDIMVDAELEDILMMDSHKNISIRVYNPGVNLGKSIVSKLKKFATDFRTANLRMHNKTFVVDGKVVITGGRNIADEYFDYDHEYNFRDRDVLLLGKIAPKVEQSFEQFWNNDLSVPIQDLADKLPENFDDPNRFERLHQYACNPENFWPQIRTQIENLPHAFKSIKESGDLVWTSEVEFISDAPGKNDGSEGLGGGGYTTDALIKLVKNARSSIDIQTPYLITTELSRNLFKDAIKRGVKIRILTNSLASTDNLEAFSGYQRDRNALLKTGVEIYEFKPDAEERFKIMTGELQAKLDFKPIFGLHSKSMVVDGETTVIGTFNLDPRSANLNTECLAIIRDKKVTEGVLKGMEIEFQPENSWQTTLDFNPDSEVKTLKRIKAWTRKIVPKEIL